MAEKGVGEHIISILVEDRFGALQRIAGVFSRRGFNMNTITVGKTDKPGLSRMTISTTGSAKTVEQMVKQLSKLVETIKVSEFSESDCVTREIALCKIHIKDYNARNEATNFVEVFRGRIIDVSHNSMIVEITGPRDKVDAFMDLMRPFGIKEFVRTGITAMKRD